MDYLERRIETLALELWQVPIGPATRARFSDLLKDLDVFSDRKLCVAPIDGVDLSAPASFGPFTLRRATRVELDRIRRLFEDAFSRSPYNSEQRAEFVRQFSDQANSALEGRVIVEFETIADSGHAHKVFLEAAGMLMDLLQMSTRIAEFCASARVGLGGHSHTGIYSAWILSLDGHDGWSQQSSVTGSVGNLCLNDGNLFLMRKAGVMRLADALGRHQSQLESAVLRAAHWFAQATLQEQRGHETLCLVIALEAIFSASRHVIAEGAARLVGVAPPEQRSIFDIVQKAYSIRNEAVHEGNAAQEFQYQGQLYLIVQRLISKCALMCDELETTDELIRRVDGMRFA